MSWYVHHPQLPYQDWLRLRATQAVVTDATAQQAQKIVGSVKDLSSQLLSNSRAESSAIDQRLDQITSTFEKGFDRLADRLDSISTSIADFNADFNWWSEKHSQQLNQIADLLEQLREALSRKHRTEAFEFFQQSLEYKYHGMFDKSLTCINIAISGDDRVRGYDLEWRFWEHLGVLQMGSEDNNSPLIVNLEKAELSFIQGARLAERNSDKLGAARCFLGSAMAAYCAGKKERAVEYGVNATRIAPDLIEAHWQLGRHQWEQGNIDEAGSSLAIALSSDYRYASRFLEDPAFAEKPSVLKELKDKVSRLLHKKIDFSEKVARVENFSKAFKKVAGIDASDLQAIIKTLKSALERKSLVDLAFLASAGPALLERSRLIIENLKAQELRKRYERIQRHDAAIKGSGIFVLVLAGAVGAFVGVFIAGALAAGVGGGMGYSPASEEHLSISRWMMGTGFFLGLCPAVFGFMKRGNHSRMRASEMSLVRELEKY